ncbi:spore coat U domain-containing protein [Bacillus subtilis]|uniref:Csu type fimbrial protein n=1 Tax=Pseudochrobactrum asaccharolyticum TaxID=354351 RepID=UPI001F1AD210|nr:spore coat U domain-containing protein [Pseudochrobactrum asaccharolyticum]MCF7647236.1 spore coat U domain-containing protein [Pseudochrobactrum asaccharolyticum]MCF7673448.1 spore coat U domain-containing protein [Bacillus subtilis]
MMTIKQIMLGLSALALSASLAPAAYAATDTGTLTVKAHIGAACTLKTKDATLDFGNLASIGDANHDAETSITVQCSKDQAYSVGLNDGANVGESSRRMKSGDNYIRYGLYQNAARTQGWGNYAVIKANGNGTDQKIPIYGRIGKQATPPAGDYIDTVAITVTY